MQNSLFAVFVVAYDLDGNLAVTTRPNDITVSFGLPGGKVDKGENPTAAVLREASEEGWCVRLLADVPFFKCTIEGKTVGWFHGEIVRKLETYHEKDNGIIPMAVSEKTFRLDSENTGDPYFNLLALKHLEKHNV